MTTVAGEVTRRGISEVVHFTTNHGVLGAFADGRVLSRKRLPENKYLAHVWKANAAYRKDHAWIDYISLSIERVNTSFFGASRNWHRGEDVWWAILGVDPEILAHDGVYFTTTNNIYPSVRRAPGVEGLKAMYDDPVAGIYGRPVYRSDGMPEAWTTCVQAEVLYPGEIDTSYVRRVYTATEEHADIVATQYDMLRRSGDARDERPELPVDVRPELFIG